MTHFTCVLAWLCVVLMVPLMLFIWALDTKKTRINRYRNTGGVGKIADIYGVSPTTARRWSMAWASVCINGKASTLLRNLFFLPLAVLLTGCNISGGGGSFNWDLPGKPEDYSCDDVDVMASSYCATGEYPQLCDCPPWTGNWHKNGGPMSS